MPKCACYTLSWSSSNQAYELYEGQEDDALDLIPDSLAWSVWVSQLSSFAFHGQNGSYTARKERKQRGGEYWYAYARVEGKLSKRYLGRGTDLTLARLEQVAQAFWLDPQAALRQKERRASSRPRSASPTPFGENSHGRIETRSASYAEGSYCRVPQRSAAERVSILRARQADTWSSEGSKHRCFRFDRLRAGAQHIVRRESGVGGRKREHESDAGGWTARRISDLPSDPLLATKLHVPHPRPHLVHRPRLLQRLQQGLEQTLILLSAPAGFGKSTLLADWLTSSAIPAAWLSLEPRDNDPARFLSYLLAALQTADLQLGTSDQALLHPLHCAPLESVLTLLLNDLQARMSGDHAHLVLVLDNYHVITNRSLHHALSFLLEHLPAQLHLVLATREDPPLPLARLRGRDEVLELRAAELRFTQQETATYLVEVMGLPLSAEQSALLQARTEGWITGLHLAALSLLHHDDPAGFITAFSGSHHYVMDYLLEEVLSRQRQAVQDFLLQTALLERLCAPLCDAVRAQDDSQAQLDFLEQANLFLIPLDNERQWYRYHQLFAETLRQRLQQTAPTLVAELHRRASRWYEQHGLFAEAVSHALAAPAPEEAARLIEQYGWAFIVGSHLQTLCGWLQALPESLVLTRPALGLLYALALMYTNHWQAASACLQTLERGIGLGEDTQEGRSLSTVLGLFKRLLAEAEAGMRMDSVLEIPLLLALALEVQGDCTGALAALGRALALAEPEGYLRLFLDEEPPMLALLHEAQRHGLAPGYVAKLLAAASKTRSADSHRQASQRSSLMEPLTARERDVLRLVLDGASNREIACQLVLSVNTAKKHVLNICGKLNVHSRAQAIAKARTLHLL